MRPHLRGPGRWPVPLAAFCGAFLPSALPGAPAPRIELPGPVLVQAAVVGAVAAVAAATVVAAVGDAKAARREWQKWREWPLLLVAASDALVRTPGLLVAVASYLVATTWRRPRHLVLYAVAASLLVTVPRPGVDLASTLGGAPLFVWLPMSLGLWTGARRQVVTGLRERAARLEREQAVRTEQARAQERARIAHDMHDVVSHRVSLMVLRAGALEISTADEGTAREAELIRRTGKEALTQLRAVLGVLTTADEEERFRAQPVLADLDRLLDQSRSAGFAVERRDEGTAADVPPMVEHTAYRVVQEALTNVHKHAGATAKAGVTAQVTARVTVRVAVRHLPAALEVTVENTAPGGPAPYLPGSGLGLLGLRERVELLGGRFTATPRPDGGFVVRARLPT
ncbi:sensor histidine kinase [Streptomyces sp. NPDC048172]|uniref:sensor histidine kinase n=1 Tax=Streptomyces sp. NPDC048172 TaxID=3365505 RepID=UPI003710B476